MPCRRSAPSSCRSTIRLTAEDFAYIIGHSGAKVVCAHADYLDAVDRIRSHIPDVEHFVALEGAKDGWIDYESAIASATPEFSRPDIDESDLLSINYTSGTTSRPKGVMITHRNAYLNIVGTLMHIRHDACRHLPVDAADVPRQWLDLHVDRHGGGRAAHLPADGSSRSVCSSSFAANTPASSARRRRC